MILDKSSFFLEIFFPLDFFLEGGLIFHFDYISLLFFSFISLISRVVFFYSHFYLGLSSLLMRFYYINNRFFLILASFVFSIIFLVFSGSWFTVLLGWDGLGLTSFLLVIFYNSRSSLVSGVITFLTNRLGDCFFILSFMYFYFSGGFNLSFLSDFSFLFFLFILLGCRTKRAQVPFSSWLPAAMAAPTPVSSLVHSSTLVTAGVFILIRFNYLLEKLNYFILFFSLSTLLLGGVCALVEIDFKKVVAMSTLRQLGFIFFSIGSGFYSLTFLHMIFHALFKSRLFLSTGRLINSLGGGQDSRFFGRINISFFSKLFFVISCLRLVGFPFSLGFYSKDIILGGSLIHIGFFFNLFFFLGCIFTVSYSCRLLRIGFFSSPSFFSVLNFLEDFYFFFPLILLYFFCIYSSGFFFFTFSPTFVFGFLESFIGVLIIVLGVSLDFLLRFPYLPFFFISFIIFIFYLNKGFSSILLKLDYKQESTWVESHRRGPIIFLIIKFNNLTYFMFKPSLIFFFILVFILLYF